MTKKETRKATPLMGPKPPPKLSQAERERFLEAMADRPGLFHATKAAGVSPRAVMALYNSDPEFHVQYEQALQCGGRRIEDRAFDLSIDGTEAPVFANGGQIGNVDKYYPQLMMFMLKNILPDHYGDRVDVTSSDGSMSPRGPATVDADQAALAKLDELYRKFVKAPPEDPDGDA
jgi:hypothetical protein